MSEAFQENEKEKQPNHNDQVKATKETKQYTCKSCELVLCSHWSLRRHIASKHNQEKWKCPQCPMILSDPSSLVRHQRRAHQKELDNSENQKNPEKNVCVYACKHECQQCHKAFPTPYKLNRHLEAHVRARANALKNKNENRKKKKTKEQENQEETDPLADITALPVGFSFSGSFSGSRFHTPIHSWHAKRIGRHALFAQNLS